MGEIGSFEAGPGIRLLLRVDGAGVVADAHFELRRYDTARAAATILCDELIGATVDEAGRVTAHAIAAISGLPPGSSVARSLYYAKSAALRPFLRAAAPPGAEITCTCFAIETQVIRDTIRRHRLKTVDELTAHLPATRGCGTCRPDVEDLLAEGR